MNPDQHARQIIRRRLERKLLVGRAPNYNELLASQSEGMWAELQRMRVRRRIIGAIRYGHEHANFRGLRGAHAAIERIKKYITTGNLECLVDASNFCDLEFIYGTHPLKHFHATDDVPSNYRKALFGEGDG